MKINYIGHSCFLFRGSNGTSLLTDPYGDVGLSFPRVFCDIVTVSHGHYDHCNTEAVGGEPIILSKPGRFSVCGVDLEAKESFHDDVNGAKRGRNLIFSFILDGVKVCHLGDLGQNADADMLRRIGKPDVLLIPVGGNYTIDGAEAAKYVASLRPAVVIPMHYHVKGLTVDICDETAFLKFVGGKYVRRSEVTLDKDSLPRSTQIIVMERSNG